MTTETMLTDEEIITIGHQARAIEPGGNGYILPVTFARAIEQAVLQSPEIQTLHKDACRYQWLRNGGNDDIGVVKGFDCIDWLSTSVACTYEEELVAEELDEVIDAAMEQQT